MPQWVTAVAEWLKRKIGASFVGQGPDFEREALTSSWTGRASLKRLLALEAGRGLVACLVLTVGTSCVLAALDKAGPTWGGYLVALVGILAPSVALLAGASYRKQEGPTAAPGAPKADAPKKGGPDES